MSTRTFDERTEKNLATLLPAVVPTFRAFLSDANDTLKTEGNGYAIRAIDGSRTYEQQDRLYAQGRTNAGDIVTNAKGGQSNHNFSIAIDIGVFLNGKWVPESPIYNRMGAIGKRNGLAWGGDWKKPDLPHFEFPTAFSLSEKRDRVAKGIPLVHAPEPAPVTATKVWSVEFDGEQIISQCLDTASVRAAVEALGGSLTVDGDRKVITIHQAG